MATRKNKILKAVTKAAENFIYNDRKHDNNLSVGEIEAAVNNKEITRQEIEDAFFSALNIDFPKGRRIAVLVRGGIKKEIPFFEIKAGDEIILRDYDANDKLVNQFYVVAQGECKGDSFECILTDSKFMPLGTMSNGKRNTKIGLH